MKKVIEQDSGEFIIPPAAIKFVKIEVELSGCGNWPFGNWDLLVNSHKEKSIRVTVETKWQYNNRPYREINYYNIPKLTKLNLGCDCWKGEMTFQEFQREIKDAIYL